VQRELAPWTAPAVGEGDTAKAYCTRWAGIPSFGAGGANAHAIVEEYIAPPGDAAAIAPTGPGADHLSAKNEERLRVAARNLCAHLTSETFRATQRPETLRDVAYTLQIGREAMEERLALVAENIDDVTSGLRAFLENAPANGRVLRGRVSDSKEALALFAEDEDLARSIERWIEKKKFAQTPRGMGEGVRV